MRQLYIIGIMSLLLAACNPKPLPIDEFDEAIFFAQGKWNNVPFSINAGDNNYFMSTSAAEDANGVTGFNGTLENLTNPNARKISIEFKNQDDSELLNKATYFTPSNFSNYIPDGNKNYRKVIVSLQENGVTYRSYKSANNISKDIFNYLEHNEYTLNAAGKPTLLVKGNVYTYLYNANNDSDSLLLEVPNMNFAIPVEL
jgi:hypothetical protein